MQAPDDNRHDGKLDILATHKTIWKPNNLETQRQHKIAKLRSKDTGRPLVLILEDNDVNMRLFSDLMEHMFECPTILTSDGEQAVRLARYYKPDLIQSDIQHPGISGLEVARLLRQDNRIRNIPLVCVTALGLPGDAEIIL